MAHESLHFEDEYTGWSDDKVFVDLLESPSFYAFDQAIDEALDRLTNRWTHWAAPNASAIRRTVKFPSAKPVSKLK